MSLKAVLFDFNGVIINDESIHQQLIEDILLGENLRPSAADYWEDCLGRSDRACLKVLLEKRGRVLSEEELTRLITKKANAYRRQLKTLSKLPIYPGVEDLIYKIRVAQLPMGVVSGALRSEVELVLDRAELLQYFPVIVAGDDIKVSKPEPDGYLLAVERLNQQFPQLNAKSSDCLAIEDTPAGIEAAKRAGMQVVGVANTYPFHMLQRQADWTVDYLHQLELERVQEVYAQVVG
ncbi:MAG: HAD family phosphatase [Coleofasciculus sp. B1-GNL1-01]|uniref:HAD family hydrolase n=1 Tax=Coleofasciculus sp. B1-GNL1-01 TaxID=3068484 RepID=UPI0032F28625